MRPAARRARAPGTGRRARGPFGPGRRDVRRAGVLLCWVLAFAVGFNFGGLPLTAAFFTANQMVAGNSFTAASGFSPTSPAASAQAAGAILVSWTSVSWATSGYTIWRSTSSTGPFTAAGTTSAVGSTTFTDTIANGLADGTTYYYQVTGRSANGGSGIATSTVSATADATAPSVSSFAPISGATGIGTNTTVSVTFSEPMQTTPTASAVTLKPCTDNTSSCTTPGTAVTVAKSWTGTTQLTLTPSSALSQVTWYQISVGTGALDLAGNAFTATTAVFRTAFSDSTAPTIVSVSPAAQASGIGTNTRVLVTFSEAMDTNLTAAAFSLKLCTDNTSTCTSPSSTAVTATTSWGYSNTVLTVAPSAYLTASQWYQAQVTSSAKDLAANAVANPTTWVFQTGAGVDTTPPSVSSVSPPDGATVVDLGTSIVITFNTAMDEVATQNAITICTTGGACLSSLSYSWNTAGTQLTVSHPGANLSTGVVYAVRLATGARSVNDLAGNSMAGNGTGCASDTTPSTCAYRTTFTTTSTADTVPPTVSAVQPTAGATGVTVGSNVVITFSEPMNTSSVEGAFTLTGGTTGTLAYTWNANNTQVTVLHGSNFATSTTYTAKVSASTGGGTKDVAGNVLMTDVSWTFTTATTTAADATPPTVSSVSPAQGAASVALTSDTTITFSEAMNTSATQGAVTVCQASNSQLCLTTISSSWDSTNTMLTLSHPNEALSGNTSYKTRISTAARDVAGNTMAGGGTGCSGDGTCAYAVTFTTTSTPDNTPPQVLSPTSPRDTAGQSGGPPAPATNASLVVTFSEPMNRTATEGAFSLTPSSPNYGTLGFAWNSTDTQVIITHSSTLAASTTYTASFTGEAKDLAGNRLNGVCASSAASCSTVAYSWSFATGTATDSTAPVVVPPTQPASGATAVATNAQVVIIFSEPMDKSSAQSAFTMSCTAPCALPPTYTFSWNTNGNIVTVDPGSTWTASKTYTVMLSRNTSVTPNTGPKDLNANLTAADSSCGATANCAYKWTFTTGTSADTTPPSAPTVTAPSSSAWTSSSTYVITGTNSVADLKVELWRDNDSSGTLSTTIDTLISSQQLSGGLTTFSFTAPLQSASTNTFLLRAVDSSGNASAVAVAPSINQGDTSTTIGTLTATAGSTTIDVKLPFTGDDDKPAGFTPANQQNSAVVQWRVGTTDGAYGSTCVAGTTGTCGCRVESHCRGNAESASQK